MVEKQPLCCDGRFEADVEKGNRLKKVMMMNSQDKGNSLGFYGSIKPSPKCLAVND
jgi:hypothetical protein